MKPITVIVSVLTLRHVIPTLRYPYPLPVHQTKLARVMQVILETVLVVVKSMNVPLIPVKMVVLVPTWSTPIVVLVQPVTLALPVVRTSTSVAQIPVRTVEPVQMV